MKNNQFFFILHIDSKHWCRISLWHKINNVFSFCVIVLEEQSILEDLIDSFAQFI